MKYVNGDFFIKLKKESKVKMKQFIIVFLILWVYGQAAVWFGIFFGRRFYGGHDDNAAMEN